MLECVDSQANLPYVQVLTAGGGCGQRQHCRYPHFVTAALKKQTSSLQLQECAVTFGEVMTAALLWRLPWMTPTVMLRNRQERLIEVELMMHALTVRDFLRKCVLMRAFRARRQVCFSFNEVYQSIMNTSSDRKLLPLIEPCIAEDSGQGWA